MKLPPVLIAARLLVPRLSNVISLKSPETPKQTAIKGTKVKVSPVN